MSPSMNVNRAHCPGLTRDLALAKSYWKPEVIDANYDLVQLKQPSKEIRAYEAGGTRDEPCLG